MRSGDRITLTGLRARGRHGVFDHERRDGQDFVVDVVVHTDHRRAAASDDLADTVNYAALADLVVARVTGAPYDLIESLADAIAQDAVDLPGVQMVEVCVHKPQAPIAHTFADVSVSVTRRSSRPFVVALGSNLGDRAQTLRVAVERLGAVEGVDVHRMSAVLESDPVGGPDQADYLNAVVLGRTSLPAPDLLAQLHRIEARLGRTRTVRWGERTLDLDLIQYGHPGTEDELLSRDPAITLPHPRAHDRAFVLLPWLDADPRARLRVGDHIVTVAARLGELDLSGVRPYAGPGAPS